MSTRTAILYYIPEDGDDLEHPNVLLLEKEMSTVTLDANKVFPIPGTYFFRFKRTFKKSWIWFDVLSDTEVVPSFEGSIICKVTRLPANKPKIINEHDENNDKQNTNGENEPEDFFGGFTSANTTKSTINNTSDSFDPFSTPEPETPADPFSSLHFL